MAGRLAGKVKLGIAFGLCVGVAASGFAAEVDAYFPGRSRLATRWLAEAEAGAADGVRPEDAFPDPGRRSDLG